MGEGRSHTVIAQQMFDTNKMDALDKAYINSRYITKDVDRTDYLDGSIGGLFRQIGANVKNALSVTEGAVDWAVSSVGQGIANIIGDGDSANGYKTGEVVKSMDLNDRGDAQFLYKLYKGNHPDIARSIDDNKIKQWQEYNNRRIEEINAEL
jgi:hypothetical protein